MADKPHLLPHLVDIDALSRQASHLDSMVAMLNHYFESTADGGDELSPELLTGYLWQMQCTIFDLRSEEHTSELQSRPHLVCRLLLEKKKIRSVSFWCSRH